jgi:hypothetical protein
LELPHSEPFKHYGRSEGLMAVIYLHSPYSDFADTQRLAEVAYLGRQPGPRPPGLCIFTCGCPKDGLVRMARDPWMRLLPFCRLYRCKQCLRRVLRVRTKQRGVYSAVYLPSSTGDYGRPGRWLETRPSAPGGVARTSLGSARHD